LPNALLRASFGDIGTGRSAGLDTVHRMRQIVLEQFPLPLIRETAAGIVRGTGTDSELQAERIRAWLTRHVGFLRDPYQVEALHTPEAMLTLLGSRRWLEVDCDDVAILGAALGMAVGLRARFVLLGAGGGYEHVWTELADPRGGDWYELDITRPFQPDFSRYDLSLEVEV
jgi:transglutaminase-like putative cysteine protease